MELEKEKKKKMNGVGSTTDCAALHRSLNPINPPGIKADKVAGFTIQNMHTTQIHRYPSIFSAVRSVALKDNLRAPKILSFGCSVGLEAFTCESCRCGAVCVCGDVESRC